MIHKYNNFIAKFNNESGLLEITCNLNGQTLEREYDLSPNINSVSLEGKYIKFDYHLGFYQLKFEGKSGIVIDLFDLDGEHSDVIGCWDFYDDLHPMFKN
jgi:hypothetical protein